MRYKSSMRIFLAAGLLVFPALATAGVFDMPQFVAPGEFAIGLEPEITLSDGAGLATNLRYTHGVSDLSNASAIIGTGGGLRQFRVGGNYTFDFFPDIEKQP